MQNKYKNRRSNDNNWDAFWKAVAICGGCFLIDYVSNEVKKYIIKEIG